MKIGVGLALVTLGAILRFAIEDDWDSVDVGVVGLILMLVGLAFFATGVALEFRNRPPVGPQPPITSAGLPASPAQHPAQPTPPAAPPGQK